MSSESSLVDHEAKFKCRPDDLKTGEWMSGTVYYKVLEGNLPFSKRVRDSYGRDLTVANSILGNEMISAAQFDTEMKVTRTEMVDKLTSAGDCVFTIKFRKQLTGQTLVDHLETEDYSGQPAAKKTKICVNALKAGEERVLTGYLRNTEASMGRSNVVDLNVDDGHRDRQVDHRTLEELILKRVKYVLK